MFLIVDTETTGLPKNWRAPVTDVENWPRIVQIAFGLMDPNGDSTWLQMLVKPDGWTIPEEVTAIHGVTTQIAVDGGIDIADVLGELQRWAEKADTVVAHNLSFDAAVIGAEYIRLNIDNPLSKLAQVCTKEIGTQLCKIPGNYGNYKWPTLKELHSHLFGSDNEDAHEALADAKACAKCWHEIRRLDGSPKEVSAVEAPF